MPDRRYERQPKAECPPESGRVSLTLAQYAARHQVSVRTVQRWIKLGRLQCVVYNKKRRRIEYRPRVLRCERCGQEVREHEAS